MAGPLLVACRCAGRCRGLVRLSKEFRLKVEPVEIFRRGDEIVLRAAPVDATGIFDALVSLAADFMADGRDDAPPQEREAL